MGRGGSPAREISFVSLVAYGPKVSDSGLAMGFTASETSQGGSQHIVIFYYLRVERSAYLDSNQSFFMNYQMCLTTLEPNSLLILMIIVMVNFM